MMNMEEYKLLNGWSRDKKKGASRYDRIPTELVEEVEINCSEDYMQFVPFELKDRFTSREFAKAAHITVSLAQTVLNILHYVGTVERESLAGRKKEIGEASRKEEDRSPLCG